MSANAPSSVPKAAHSAAPEPFLRRHATGLTLICVLGFGAGLGVAPVPAWLKPVDLSTPENVRLVAERITRKPNMTFKKLTVEPDAPPEEDEESVEVATAAEPVAPVVVDEPILTAVAPQRAPKDDAATKRGFQRRIAPATKSAKLWRKQARELRAPGSPVDNPCKKHGPKGCKETALDPFYVALDAVAKREEGAHVNVITLGNSLIASDHVTDIVRRRLVQSFGDGGRGFVLPDRLSKVAGRRVRTGHASPTWRINTFAQRPPKRRQFGFSGSHHESTRKGDQIRWKLRGAEHARLFWLDHKKRPSFDLLVDGKRIKRIPRAKYKGPKGGQDRITDMELPTGAKTLSLVAQGPGAVIYGVALTRPQPGVSWDTIGVPAADATMYVEKTDPGIFTRQLKAREPDLMVFMLGGNETRTLAFGWKTPAQIRAALQTLIDRSMTAVPGAACLVVAPIDNAKATAAGARLTTRKELFDVVEIEHEVALEKGCAYFNLFEAMGGKDSFQRFHRRGLVNDDLVHPTGAGGNILGQLFADALLQNYLDTPVPALKARKKSLHLSKPRLLGLTFPGDNDDAFAQTFAKLRALEAGTDAGASAQRVAIGLFGGSHLANHQLPDRLRERFTERFGSAGHGFVSVGGRDRYLLPSRVTRRLVGDVSVTDGRHVVLGGAMSMAGRAARLEEGARFELTFCDGCREGEDAPPGMLDVTWLYTPGMGKADLYVNDVWVGVLGPATRKNRRSDVQLLRVPVRGEAHQLSVRVRQPPDEAELERRRQRRSKNRITKSDAGPFGPVTLLSVAGEIERSGVVVDDVGIAGTTGMTMQRWRQDLIAEQVAARDYDLLVLMWGSYEARLKKLDEVTYRHHLNGTLATLTGAGQRDKRTECLLIGPTDQLLPARKGGKPSVAGKSHAMVTRVQKELAAQYGCAYFDAQRAMGGPGSIARWAKKGFAKRDGRTLTKKGKRAFADGIMHDLMAWYAYRAPRAKPQPVASDEPSAAVARPTFKLDPLDVRLGAEGGESKRDVAQAPARSEQEKGKANP